MSDLENAVKSGQWANSQGKISSGVFGEAGEIPVSMTRPALRDGLRV
mgnify:FL=1